MCTNKSAYTKNTAYLVFRNWEFSFNRHKLVVISEIRITFSLLIITVILRSKQVLNFINKFKERTFTNLLTIIQCNLVGEFYMTNICRILCLCVFANWEKRTTQTNNNVFVAKSTLALTECRLISFSFRRQQCCLTGNNRHQFINSNHGTLL